MNKSANTFLEYVIILGVISAALLGMNTYIKRGFQGQLKEMTDYFISNSSNSQLVQVNPSTSHSNTISGANIDSADFIGGGTALSLSETRNIKAVSRAEERESTFIGPLIPAESGEVTTPIRLNDSAYADPHWETRSEISNLEADRDRKLNEAVMLDTNAPLAETQGQNLINQANSIGCPRRGGGGCEAARNNLRSDGNRLVLEASGMRVKANNLRNEAVSIQDQIDELNNQLAG